MNLYKYLSLTDDDQVNELCSNGTFLLSRTEAICVVSLFALHDYYVEAYFNTQTDEIDRLRSFRSYSRLDPYLPLISIEKMLNI